MSLDQDTTVRRRPMKGLLRRFFVRRDGATAIEFTILTLPFFIIMFASFETFVAFSAEQLLANATDTMARKIRTGEITYNLGKPSDMTKDEFRAAFCAEIAIMMKCSADELKAPNKLWLDVRSFKTFAEIPKVIPLTGTDLDTSSFKYEPGGKKSINVIRAYYRWSVMADVVRPYVSNIKSADGKQTYLMIATAVVKNEDYP
jgi:Flp pilus assembly protein TadG